MYECRKSAECDTYNGPLKVCIELTTDRQPSLDLRTITSDFIPYLCGRCCFCCCYRLEHLVNERDHVYTKLEHMIALYYNPEHGEFCRVGVYMYVMVEYDRVGELISCVCMFNKRTVSRRS